MKRFYLASLLALSTPFMTHAGNDFSNFAAELKSASEGALQEMAAQVAIKINVSDIQRMLAQKMVKEALLITLDVDAEKNKTNLKASNERFETILMGLQTSDEALALTEVKNKKVFAQLTKVSALWDAFKATTTTETLNNDAITAKSLPLIVAINKLVDMYGRYCGENLNQLAILINLSGRQRLLIQKMTTEYLLLATENDKTTNQTALKKTMQHFEGMLTSLTNGDKQQGLPATSDKAILVQLNKVQTEWKAFKPLLEADDTSKAALQKIASMNVSLLATMDKAVEMYKAQSTDPKA
jgi:hypothetical protein